MCTSNELMMTFSSFHWFFLFLMFLVHALSLFFIFSRWKGEEVSQCRVNTTVTQHVRVNDWKWNKMHYRFLYFCVFAFLSHRSFVLSASFASPLECEVSFPLLYSVCIVVLASPSRGTIDSTVALYTLLCLDVWAACEKDITWCTRELLKRVKSHTAIRVQC